MFSRLSLAAACAAALAAAAAAEPVSIEAVLSPTDEIRLDFEDGSRHFLLMVRREGVVEGGGPLGGAAVTEFGAHDITPGVGGDPRGYLVIETGPEDKLYVKWQVRAVFVPGPDGKPMLLDNGFWEVAGGVGRHAGLKGAGTLHIKPASPTDRRFILSGELFPAK